MTKDILFSLWYESLEGTKSQGFAYKAWCAGWEAGQKPWVSLTEREIEKAIVSTAPSFKPDDVAQTIEAALRSKNND